MPRARTSSLPSLRADIKTCAPIHFDGNGYSDEWVAEAEKRGLDTEKSCPVIFDRYLDESSIKMFESMGVMKENHYQSQLAKNVENMMAIFGAEEGKKLSERNLKIIKEIAERTSIIEKGVEDLVNARKVANKIEDAREKAVAYHDTVESKFQPIRYQIDKLELVVADELWTLPKYRELLFIR